MRGEPQAVKVRLRQTSCASPLIGPSCGRFTTKRYQVGLANLEPANADRPQLRVGSSPDLSRNSHVPFRPPSRIGRLHAAICPRSQPGALLHRRFPRAELSFRRGEKHIPCRRSDRCHMRRILKKMLALGLSRYEPHPLRAIAEAEQRRTAK
jgi:hypothetical protein